MASGLTRIAAFALPILALDRLSKLWIVEWLDLKTRLFIEAVPPFLQFRMAWNRGVNFGLFGSDSDAARWVLIAIALAISAGLLIWARRAGGWVLPGSVGLIVGGALGNVWDRVQYGAVADFLNVSCCGIDNPYAFNIADAAIFAGVAGLILLPGANKRA